MREKEVGHKTGAVTDMPDSAASQVSASVSIEHPDIEAGAGEPTVELEDATVAVTEVPPTVTGLSPFQTFSPPNAHFAGQESSKSAWLA